MTFFKIPKRKRYIFLSRKQSDTLGGLVQVLSNKKPIDSVIQSLRSSNLVTKKNNCYMVTEKGLEETDRLLRVGGIFPREKEPE
tara:strand:- start:487 stop:738 length:252 start_codon:yes stop_codon:yes gene_type:complete